MLLEVILATTFHRVVAGLSRTLEGMESRQVYTLLVALEVNNLKPTLVTHPLLPLNGVWLCRDKLPINVS